MKRYAARRVSAREKASLNEHNGVVEDVTSPKTPNVICYVSPMAQALRIAHALNVLEKFSNDELERLSEALSP